MNKQLKNVFSIIYLMNAKWIGNNFILLIKLIIAVVFQIVNVQLIRVAC